MPAPFRLIVALVTSIGLLGFAAPANAVEAVDGRNLTPQPTSPASYSNGQVTTQATASTPGTGAATSGGADPCSYALSMVPEIGGSGLMVPQVRDINGSRFIVYLKTCPGDSGGTVFYVQIFTTTELTAIARDRVTKQLPKPVPQFAGQTGPWQYTHVPTVLWVDRTQWQPFTLTATASGIWSTVTVTPIAIIFDPGDGNPPVRCDGPGTPFPADGLRYPQSSLEFKGEPGECGYIYDHSSVNAPHLTYSASMSMEWSAAWAASDGTTGRLNPIIITTPISMKVARIQVLGN